MTSASSSGDAGNAGKKLTGVEGSLFSVRRNEIWEENMGELSPDSRELFADLEEAERDHGVGHGSRKQTGFSFPLLETPGNNEGDKAHCTPVPAPAPPGSLLSSSSCSSPNSQRNTRGAQQRLSFSSMPKFACPGSGATAASQRRNMTPASILKDSSHREYANDDSEYDRERTDSLVTDDDRATVLSGDMLSRERSDSQVSEDEDAKLARRLMMEEEANLYERLQQEQLHAIAAMQNETEEEDGDMALARRLLAEEEEQLRLAQERIELDETESVDPDEMSYDQLLELGERIGDVKQERWRIDGKQYVSSLKLIKYSIKDHAGKGVNFTKCIVCQYDYEDGEELKILPCTHAFHAECINPWLETHDTCATCKQSLKDLLPKQNAEASE
eukprot:CAMPEP_0203761598 /NCGR_PEP_ID=MMETSP0098-20131031/14646_1 /ASSEMBLY_ACC=CAM_ASM_000208 /TAXON_ID=96639 /ORGANISM=" , Strain NY0313808BC1" /LENGTH=387 /DNA_ID=CAMNT_0050655653 /DNA_START=525 /DNA_END=1688 /DNA_ORIENTATION=+